MVTSLDLFAGAGGLSIGLMHAGITSVCAVEHNQYAANSFSSYLPTTEVLCTDIRKINLTAYRGQVALICGGPPCQPFSSGGLRGASTDERDMLPWFTHALEAVLPEAFLMENVPGLVVGSRQPYFASIISAMRTLGYFVTWKVLNAADYGVPQSRHRLFVVGMRRQPFIFPLPTHGIGCPLPHVSVNDVLPLYQIGEPNRAIVTYAKKPDLRPSPYHGQVFNGGGRPINRELPSPTILASAGGNKTHFLDDLNLVPAYHRSLLEGGAPREGILPGARRLSVLESAILQTFPADMMFHGPRSAQYQQIGNAVPPLLAAALGRALNVQLLGSKEAATEPSRWANPVQYRLTFR